MKIERRKDKEIEKGLWKVRKTERRKNVKRGKGDY
jgi:hypothetical protein